MTTSTSLSDERLRAWGDRLAAESRELYDRGWMDGTSGNLSVRTADGHAVLITASGMSKGRITADDTVLVGADDGTALQPGSLRPSAETEIHLAVYRCLPDCGAVVHAHGPYATAVASRESVPGQIATAVFEDLELIKGLGVPDPARAAVPVFPNWADVSRIAADVETHLATGPNGRPPALLIAHHGVTAWGADLEQARNHFECIEALCQLRLLMGG